jgi:hypothetical protein
VKKKKKNSKQPKKKTSKFSKYFSKGKCFNCEKSGHFTDKCPKPPKNIKQEINALNIDGNCKENIFIIFQNNDFFDYSSENDLLTSDDSDYHSASEFFENIIKVGCIGSCCFNTKNLFRPYEIGRTRRFTYNLDLKN